MIGISFPELLRFDEQETERWHQFLASKARLRWISRSISASGKTVLDLLLHIFGVELEYAERISGGPLTQPADLPARTVDEIFSIATTAQETENYLKTASDADLNGKNHLSRRFPPESRPPAGAKCSATRSFHSLRHWAQLTTEMRRRGHLAEWHHRQPPASAPPAPPHPNRPTPIPHRRLLHAMAPHPRRHRHLANQTRRRPLHPRPRRRQTRRPPRLPHRNRHARPTRPIPPQRMVPLAHRPRHDYQPPLTPTLRSPRISAGNLRLRQPPIPTPAPTSPPPTPASSTTTPSTTSPKCSSTTR